MSASIVKYAILAAEVGAVVWCIFRNPDPGHVAIVALILLAAVGVLAELRVLAIENVSPKPSKSPWLLGMQRTITWEGLIFLLPHTSLFSYVANSYPAPSWFPTPHGVWFAVPWLLFGVLAVWRRW